MTGKDLSLALGDIHPKFYDEAEHDTIASPATAHRPFHRTFLIAAIIATMLLLGTAAYARYVGIHLKLDQRNQETTAEKIGVSLSTQAPEAVKNALTDCYPQVLPQGYYILEGALVDRSTRTIRYINDAKNEGDALIFYISTGHDFHDLQTAMESMRPNAQKKELEIAGCSAAYLSCEEGEQMLLWHNEADGYYACLSTGDAAVDLPAIAESVGFGEKLPSSFLYNRGKLWDIWYPQKLPEGYICEDVGPVVGGGQEIRYRIETEDGNVRITYNISLFADMGDISDPPHSSIKREERTVRGEPAKLITVGSHQWILCWRNEQEGFYARLDTQDENVDLVAIAESVMHGEKLEVSSNYLGADYTIEMKQDQTTYVGWEPIYPQEIPEGYSLSFVTDPSYGEQMIRYENAAGDMLIYNLYFRLGKWGRAFGGMGQPEQVDINGNIGYLEKNRVIWTDAARGYGFCLVAADAELDLLAMAKSVGPGPELKPTYGDKTEKALEQLGDYQITALPDGMVQDGLTGSSLEDGGDWYAYVRRWYFHELTNAEIYFEYESYITDGSFSKKDVVLAQIGGEDEAVQTVTVNGCTGAALQKEKVATVVWALGDETKGVVFEMFSEHFTVEELLEIAQSVQKSDA